MCKSNGSKRSKKSSFHEQLSLTLIEEKVVSMHRLQHPKNVSAHREKAAKWVSMSIFEFKTFEKLILNSNSNFKKARIGK